MAKAEGTAWVLLNAIGTRPDDTLMVDSS